MKQCNCGRRLTSHATYQGNKRCGTCERKLREARGVKLWVPSGTEEESTNVAGATANIWLAQQIVDVRFVEAWIHGDENVPLLFKMVGCRDRKKSAAVSQEMSGWINPWFPTIHPTTANLGTGEAILSGMHEGSYLLYRSCDRKISFQRMLKGERIKGRRSRSRLGEMRE